MGALTNTELAATIDEVWDLTTLEARYAAAVIMPRILNKSDNVSRSGDIVHIPIKKKRVVGSVTAAGAFTPDAQTVTQVDVTVDTWKYVSDETTDQAEAQSYYDPASDFPEGAGKALGEDYDGAIANLYTNLTSNIVGNVSAGSVFDDSLMLASMLKLANLNVPKASLSYVLPPIAFYGGLFKLERFTNADITGFPKTVLTTNFRFPLLGIPAYETTLLKTVTDITKGFLLHKEAFAIAMSINNKIKRSERTAGLVLSNVVVMQGLYGVKTVREDHACLINIKAT